MSHSILKSQWIEETSAARMASLSDVYTGLLDNVASTCPEMWLKEWYRIQNITVLAYALRKVTDKISTNCWFILYTR